VRSKFLDSPFDAIGDGFLLAGFVASKSWVQSDPATAHRFVLAMREAARWANKHHAETARILAQTLDLEPSVVNAMSRTTFAETLTPEILQAPLDLAARYGIIKAMKADELIPEAARP
jgi:ABC-type nitrate/sulfonate/bicarbonate transport system substrate-binding protein